ncbi:S28 family serine protease [Longispora albida]|uniref:S28 family serine protease n=1 Tax=Longispora albida TaxID=203523 RepID=UPI00035CCFDA|nr:S28 family serine protease [Longispora albida]
MNAFRRLALPLALLAGLLAVPASPSAAAGEDIADRLRAIPGMTITEERPATAPYRFFVLAYTQPADHRKPSAGTFQQRLTLLHKDAARPMVLHTTGYNVPVRVFRSEPARLVDGNQISVEQRFFTPSRPASENWSKLNVWQAATDHHRLVTALKPLYAAKWISTGASKGGMTSVYHRRFYPSDVDGTVAYVAPNDVIAREDSAYDEFFTQVGDAACRKALDDVQVEALKRRAEFVPRYEAWAAAGGYTFSIVKSADRAFEFMVNGTTWAFWQYGSASDCAGVPPVTATSDVIWDWMDNVYGASSNTDQGVTGFVPYYYQAGTQLGYPLVDLPHLAKLQKYRGQDVARSYVPASIPMWFNPVTMIDVDLWVKLSGRNLLFVYGQNDPWGAEPFQTGIGTRDSYSYTAPGANHGANIGALVTSEKDSATSALLRWAGVTPSLAGPSYVPDLDDYNPALDRKLNPVR